MLPLVIVPEVTGTILHDTPFSAFYHSSEAVEFSLVDIPQVDTACRSHCFDNCIHRFGIS